MSEDAFKDRLVSALDSLSPSARRVAQFIDHNRLAVVSSSAMGLAQAIGTSDATVVRSIQAMGFSGLNELRQVLLQTLNRNSAPADNMRETLAEIGENIDHAISSVIETNLEGLRFVSSKKVQRQIAAAVRLLHPCARIKIFAIGPSRGIAEYTRRVLMRHGRWADLIDATGIQLADQLIDLQQNDGVIMLAFESRHREIDIVLNEAKRLNCPVALITDKLAKTVMQRATVVVPARRGRENRVALHGATFIVLETIAFGLAASGPMNSMQALERLTHLRSGITAQP